MAACTPDARGTGPGPRATQQQQQLRQQQQRQFPHHRQDVDMTSPPGPTSADSMRGSAFYAGASGASTSSSILAECVRESGASRWPASDPDARPLCLSLIADVATPQQSPSARPSVADSLFEFAPLPDPSPLANRPPPRQSHDLSATTDVFDASDDDARDVALTGSASVGPEELDGSWTLNQLVVLHAIGRGAQGEVHLAFDTAAGELRAVKSIPRPAAMRPLPTRRVSVAPLSPSLVRRASMVASRALSRRQSLDIDTAAGDATGCALAAGTGIVAVRLRRAEAKSGARDSNASSSAALKRQRLDAEIAALRRCRHRSVVRLHEVIDDPECDSVHLVMQYVERGPLAALDATGAVDRAVPLAELAGYAAQLAAGLAYLHRKGVVHRDIKPDNVLLGDGGRVYLADFGVAALTAEPGAAGDGEDAAEHAPAGTLVFRAPEVLRGEAAGVAALKAADVWALGVTLYALTYGRLPWRVGPDVPRAHVLDQILDPQISFPPIAVDDETERSSTPSDSAVASVNDSLDESTSTNATPPPMAEGSIDAHEWFAVLRSMLETDPAKRPKASAVAADMWAIVAPLATPGGTARTPSWADSFAGSWAVSPSAGATPLAHSADPAAASFSALPC